MNQAMIDFLIYQGKAAVALAAFYMFYRLLLSKETFHRFNRFMLVGIMLTSLITPLFHITTEHPTVINDEFRTVQTFIEHSPTILFLQQFTTSTSRVFSPSLRRSVTFT